MDIVSFFKLFLEFNHTFHEKYNNISLTVSPFTIGLESICINSEQLDELLSFVSSRNIDFKYSFYYVQIGVRLIFTFIVD